MSVKRYGWASNPFLHEHSEGLYVLASDYDALQARVAKLEAALVEVKAAHDVCAEMVLLPDDLMARIARLLVNQSEGASDNSGASRP